MFKFSVKQILPPKQSVYRGFLLGFVSLALVFFLMLLPLIFYSRTVFTDLEIQKSTQHMSFGISQLETTVDSVNSAAQKLRGDMRFLPFYYADTDYTGIPTTTGTAMKDYLASLMFPVPLVSDWALQFTDRMALTPSRYIAVEDAAGYYPDFFKIDNLDYKDWENILSENGIGFLSVHHVTTLANSYDALIYSLPWINDSYLYVCLNIRDIKQSLIENDNIEDFRVTIESSDGDCLYSDLSEELTRYHSVTEKTSIGGLSVTVHIPDSVLNERISPLYSFLAVYLGLCIAIVFATIVVGSRLSARPVMRILQSYETDLQSYRTTIDTQSKVLRARFMEKALHGSLATDKDYEAFFSYFPQFPQKFRLILVGLLERPVENGNTYPNAFSIIQFYLQQLLPNAYQQQLTVSTMLLVIDEKDYGTCCETINYLMSNINREEPCYHAWGIISNAHEHPKSIPLAYWQIQDLNSRVSAESLSQLCTVSDYRPSRKMGFQMADSLSIYSAITSGNKEMAIMRLDSYSEHLNAKNRSVFEIFRSILQCIKQEYADLLIDAQLPYYHANLDMYASLADAISGFCDKFRTAKEPDTSKSFAQEVKAYIDMHFAEESLCGTALEEQFGCSYAKIRKAFSQDLGTSISVYIEAKRMELANELLIRGEDSVTDVARKCGFASYNTFHKAYKRVFGQVPTSLKSDKA